MTALRTWIRSVWFVLAFLGVVVVLHLILGDAQQIFVTPFLIVCPALAAATASPWGVAAVGALVLAVRQALLVFDGAVAEFGDLHIFETRSLGYLGVIGVSIFLAYRRERRDRKISDLTSVALAAEETILRPLPAVVGDIRVGVRYLSSAAEAVVGGDVYEVLDTEFGTRIIVGDVKGSGLGAVFAASVVLGSFRAVAYDEPDLASVASRIERMVLRHLGEDDFVTIMLTQVEADVLRLVHRGHVPPMIVSGDGVTRTVEPPAAGPPLGLGYLDSEPIKAWVEPFKSGDSLVLYTDGVTDARGPAGSYPLADRVRKLVDSDATASAERLCADLVNFVGHSLKDDAVLLVATRA